MTDERRTVMNNDDDDGQASSTACFPYPASHHGICPNVPVVPEKNEVAPNFPPHWVRSCKVKLHAHIHLQPALVRGRAFFATSSVELSGAPPGIEFGSVGPPLEGFPFIFGSWVEFGWAFINDSMLLRMMLSVDAIAFVLVLCNNPHRAKKLKSRWLFCNKRNRVRLIWDQRTPQAITIRLFTFIVDNEGARTDIMFALSAHLA